MERPNLYTIQVYVTHLYVACHLWSNFLVVRCEDEQNMVAYQHCGEIYYRTFRDIHPGDELLVWYGEEYARDLGIALLPGQGINLLYTVCMCSCLCYLEC